MTSCQPAQSGYVGRFAPSPTGDLHFGSLLAAMGSYLQAKSKGGKWLIRIEDIDPPREIEGSTQRILADLERLGLVSDEPVLLQSARMAAYASASRTLVESGKAFQCACSRADLPSSGIYPGTCRNGLDGIPERVSVRLRVEDAVIHFQDGIMGPLSQDLASEVGDFVISRSDGLPAYQLAVVLDDAFQEVTEVVRGADLLESTPRQIFLQKALGLPTPQYLHLPVVTTSQGQKLSKRVGSDPLNLHEPAAVVEQVLQLLGQTPPRGLDLSGLLEWATEHWDAGSIPREASMPAPSLSVPGD